MPNEIQPYAYVACTTKRTTTNVLISIEPHQS